MIEIHFDGRRAHANEHGYECVNANARGHGCGGARDRPQHVCARRHRRRVDAECQAQQAGCRHTSRLTVQDKSVFEGVSCETCTYFIDGKLHVQVRSFFVSFLRSESPC